MHTQSKKATHLSKVPKAEIELTFTPPPLHRGIKILLPKIAVSCTESIEMKISIEITAKKFPCIFLSIYEKLQHMTKENFNCSRNKG